VKTSPDDVPMPRLSSRQSRAREVLRTFIDYHTARIKRVLRQKNKAERTFARAGKALDDAQQLIAASTARNSLRGSSGSFSVGHIKRWAGSSTCGVGEIFSINFIFQLLLLFYDLKLDAILLVDPGSIHR
jgi:hypothetical protein